MSLRAPRKGGTIGLGAAKVEEGKADGRGATSVLAHLEALGERESG
jgi:hypothetical protein